MHPSLDDRGPLRVLFCLTSMPVGGAETLLVNLIRRLDRERFVPEVCCLKEPGPLGDELSYEIPVHSHMLRGKFDVRVLPRLVSLMRRRRIDAVVTVGAGDKMFWGRLAARIAGVPVVASALHSTGWPDGVGRLNRLLTPLTDAFIAVAAEHGRFLAEFERFPASKVFVIPNGVDVGRFRPNRLERPNVRRRLSMDVDAPTVGIVAALRPEKNHRLFLQAAAETRASIPNARFVIVGDGPLRPELEAAARELGVADAVHFFGTRGDIPEVLAALDLFALTSDNEANPVSILEAMACGIPVVATRVGSVADSVGEGKTGFLVPPGDSSAAARRWIELLADRDKAQLFGDAGRERVVDCGSLECMVDGYERLLATLYARRCGGTVPTPRRSIESRESAEAAR